MQSAQVLARWTARTERVSSHQLHHEPRTKRSERGVQLMASDKATQYPANGFSFRGLTSYLANNNNTQTNNDFSSPVAESSAADRPRAPAALGERDSVNGYLQRLCLQRSQLLRSVRSGSSPRKGQAACRLVVATQSPFSSSPLAWNRPPYGGQWNESSVPLARKKSG